MSFCRRLQQVVLLLACISNRSELMAQSSIWGLTSGDRFVVETIISQSTTVSLDDTEAVTTQSTETLHVEYRVERILPAETHFYVQITEAKTSDESASVKSRQRIGLLKDTVVRLAVDKTGVTRIIGGYEESMARLADRDERTLKILKDAFPPDAFTSWITRPFWMVAPKTTLQKNTAWERLDNVSLGTMGTVRAVANCEVSDVEDNVVSITVSGQGRYVPHPDQRLSSSSTLTFTNVVAKNASLTGEGKMWVPSATADTEGEVDEDKDDDSLQSEVRPGFESLTLQWNLEGAAQLNVSAKMLNVSFRESQTQKSRLLPGSVVRAQTPAFSF